MTTVAILLGASEWPRSEGRLTPSVNFSNSSRDFRKYLLDINGLAIPSDQILDLFDSSASPNDIDETIADFLSTTEDRSRTSIENVILHYVGHGLFSEDGQKYAVALRCTRPANIGASAYVFSSLARTLNRKAARARRFVILDACYAAAASGDLQPQSERAEHAQLQILSVLAESGTALLCAASSSDVALSPKTRNHTMFSEALLYTLTAEPEKSGSLLSFDDIRSGIDIFIRKSWKEEGVKPELHIPDQRRGDISKIAFFPNIHGRSASRQAAEIEKISKILEKLNYKIDTIGSDFDIFEERIQKLSADYNNKNECNENQFLSIKASIDSLKQIKFDILEINKINSYQNNKIQELCDLLEMTTSEQSSLRSKLQEIEGHLFDQQQADSLHRELSAEIRPVAADVHIDEINSRLVTIERALAEKAATLDVQKLQKYMRAIIDANTHSHSATEGSSLPAGTPSNRDLRNSTQVKSNTRAHQIITESANEAVHAHNFKEGYDDNYITIAKSSNRQVEPTEKIRVTFSGNTSQIRSFRSSRINSMIILYYSALLLLIQSIVHLYFGKNFVVPEIVRNFFDVYSHISFAVFSFSYFVSKPVSINWQINEIDGEEYIEIKNPNRKFFLAFGHLLFDARAAYISTCVLFLSSFIVYFSIDA